MSFDFLGDPFLAGVVGILGLIISLVGFGFTIAQLRKTRNAAQAAEDAVKQVRLRVQQTNTITDLTSALAMMGEVKNLQRIAAWQMLPDRYSSLRRMALEIKSSEAQLNDTQRLLLQESAAQFSILEDRIEQHLAGRRVKLSADNMNKVLSAQIDVFQEILTNLRRNLGE